MGIFQNMPRGGHIGLESLTLSHLRSLPFITLKDPTRALLGSLELSLSSLVHYRSSAPVFPTVTSTALVSLRLRGSAYFLFP